MLRVLVLSVLVFFFFGAVPVLAQDSLSVRTGSHEGYARLVFDWQEPTGFDVKKPSANTVILSFDKPTVLNGEAGTLSMDPRIEKVEVLSSPDENLEISLTYKTGMEVRYFNIGDRIVLDVIGDGPRQTDSEVSQKSTPKQVSENKDMTDEATQVKAVPAETVEKRALDDAIHAVEPHVISFSTTEAAGLAVYRRNHNLWIVVDRPDVKAPPELKGPTQEKFATFDRHELRGGVAYRLPLFDHPDINVYGEGGGLVWRIILTPNTRKLKPVEMKRSFLKDDNIRGGTVVWPMSEISKVLEVPDPYVGDIIKVATVGAAGQFAGEKKDFVDFDQLESIIGLAVRPEVDDLKVQLGQLGVVVSRPAGLAMSRMKDITRRKIMEDVSEPTIADISNASPGEMKRIFDFDRWMMGGLQALDENERILMNGMRMKDKDGLVQDLLTLAKMSIANDRGQEALGYLAYAGDEMPDITKSIEFRALRAAANALAGKYENAMSDLLDEDLKGYGELDYWLAFTLAWLEDWQQAQTVMPSDYEIFVGYPRVLLEKMGIKLAEIALRSGDVATAEAIIAVLTRDMENLNSQTIAAISYLKGEAHRQSGEYDAAMTLWEELTKGKDDLYRAKSGLALTMLQLELNEITREQTIDRLEGLRYAWRGDELEARINLILGKMYIEDGSYLKGFGILREAATMSPQSDIGREITSHMAEQFKTILMEDENLSPLDAVTVYEEFVELTPSGEDGNELIQKLAERLVEADLLERASGILRHQVDYRLGEENQARVATRLAAIYLLNREPDQALTMLDKAQPYYESQSGSTAQSQLKKIKLMRARALSQNDKTEEALELLAKFNPSPDVNRLRADIAWQAGLWEDAAEALQDLILDEDFDLERPLTQDQADLILNRSVALHLSGNRVALANMRKRYEDAMKKTARAKLFDVITRPRQSAFMADRQTLESIVSEVDIFKEFLESFKNSDISN